MVDLNRGMYILPPYCWSSWQTKASRWLKDTLSPSQIYLSCLSRPLAVYSLYGKNLCDASFLFYFRSLSWPNLDFKAWLRASGPQSANRVLVCDSDACSSTSASPKTGPWIPRTYLAHRDDTDLLNLLFFLLSWSAWALSLLHAVPCQHCGHHEGLFLSLIYSFKKEKVIIYAWR